MLEGMLAGRSRNAVVGGLLLAHALAAAWVFHGVRFDDAFIVYRYGQNLAEGRGLVFNPGEVVWGATTVTWTLLSALVHALAGHRLLPDVMAALGALCWTAQVWLLMQLTAFLPGRWTRWLPVMAVALGAAGSFCWVGMEINLAAALGLAAALSLLRGRSGIAGVWIGLAVLARPDALALLAAWAAAAVFDKRLRSARLPLAAFAVMAPWYAYQWFHFGAALSNSILNKKGASGFEEYGLHLLAQLPGEIAAMITGWNAPRKALLLAPVVWPIATFGAISAVRADRRYAILAGWLVAHAAGLLWWRPLVNQTWQLYDFTLVGTALFWVGIGALMDGLARSGPLRRAALPAAVTTLMCLALARTAWFGARDEDVIFWFGGRHAVYARIAEELRAAHRPGEEVAAGEVGTLAYFSDLPVRDWNGLTTRGAPRLVASLAAGKPGAVRWIVAWARSDLAYFRRSVAHHPIRVFPTPDAARSIYLVDLRAN